MTMERRDSESPVAEEEGLISRWSRRKHEAKASSAEMDPVTDVPSDAEDVVENLPEDSDMPPLETLDEDSDYSGFMSPKVSDGLRTLALRQLFRGSMFNVRDGLDDYDDDFTKFTSLGDVITAEMRRQMARLKEADDEDPVEASDDDQDSAAGVNEGPLSEEISELSFDAEAGTGQDEPLAGKEQFNGKEDSGESLHANKDR